MTKPEDKVSTATGAASGSGAGVSSAIANLMSGFEKLTKSSDIHSWIEQFEVFCVLNKFEENTKNLVFISLMSQEVYGIVRESLVPEKPTEKPYAELKKLVLQFMSPAPNFLMERYSFRECRQESLSIAQYAVKLRKLSEFCKFEETLDSALRDQLIWGVEDTTIKKRLLAEGGTMKFHDCIKLATTIESATKDATKLQGSAVHQVAAISKKFSTFKSQVPVKSQKQGMFVPKCWCCGTKGHTKPQCQYKDTTCGTCKRKGHMTAVCRSGKRNSVPVHCVEEREVDEEYHLSNLFCIQEDSAKPLELSLRVNKAKVKFQVDTGSPITAMSLETAKHHEIDGVLRPTNIQFKGYTGGHMKSLGYVEVFVNESFKSKLFIFQDAGPPIVGREWLFKLKLLNENSFSSDKLDSNINSISNDKLVPKLISKYPNVFSTDLGCFNGKECKLHLKPDAVPKFFNPRPLPFALKDKVATELDRMVKDNIIYPVNSSEWGTPIVPVVKPNGDVRICGDYKVTVNKFLHIDRHPIPRITDLLTRIKGSCFAKLDLSRAYLQVPLCSESQLVTTISTHKGLFAYKKLPYGIASAPGLFQREMDKLFIGFGNVICFFDDIFICGTDEADLQRNLELVLQKLSEVGLTVNRDKCKFFKNEIEFLGYNVNKDGISIPESKCKAIKVIKQPTNVTELKSFLGFITYYAKFVPKLSLISAPLYRLLKKDQQWVWGKTEEKSFNDIKSAICSNCVLAHYDPSLVTLVSTDASNVGIAGVLSQVDSKGDERPVAFCSRSLSPAERKYSVLDKEALALVYSVKYFHQYLYGREFRLRTDHRGLIYIFGETKGLPAMSAQRLQRYAVFLQGYNYKIEYIKGENNVHADILSRSPLPNNDGFGDDPEGLFVNFIYNDLDILSDVDVKAEIENDPILRNVKQFILTGKWPDNCIKSLDLRPYFFRRNELSVESDLILWGHRLVIPTRFKKKILDELHTTHLGIVKMKSLARAYVWWPGIDSEIELISKSCTLCLQNRDNPPKVEGNRWPKPTGPGVRVHVDFFGPINNMYFLVIVDAYSKWLFVKRMPNITTEATICAFREYFSTWGIPRKLCSDNGPSLCSKDMETFLKNNGVQHLLTPPFHPSSNGAAENAVRTCKNFIKKVDWNSKTIDFLLQRFALGHNSTKHIATNQSPAELHIGRTLSTALDRFKNKLSVPENDIIVKSKFKVNDHVMFRNFSHGAKWEAGKIHKVLSPVVYLVDNLSGMFLKRHADQMFSYVPDHGSVISNPWLDIPSYKSSPEKVKTPVNSSQENASKVPTPTTPVSRNVRLPSPNILSRPRRTVKPRVILDL